MANLLSADVHPDEAGGLKKEDDEYPLLLYRKPRIPLVLRSSLKGASCRTPCDVRVMAARKVGTVLSVMYEEYQGLNEATISVSDHVLSPFNMSVTKLRF